MAGDYVRFVLQNLRNRRVRSWLTMIGIFVGIAAVVALISLGQGLQDALAAEFQELGADKILISPAGSSFGIGDNVAAPLTEDDVKVVDKVRGVAESTGFYFKVATISWGREDIGYYFVQGLPDGDDADLILAIAQYDVEFGRMLKDGESNKAVIGHDYMFSSSFGKNIRPGNKINVNNREFEVVGVFKRIGNQQDDRSIIIPLENFKDIFDVDDEVNSIYVQADSNQDPKVVADRISRDLRDYRDVDEGNEDFEIQTLDEFLNSFLSIFSIVSAILTGIASISLLVGAVGITNSMYTSVLERRKEIGIMKSVGARNGNILRLFMLESGFLGLVGGLLGVIIGIIFAKLVEIIATQALGTDLLKAAIPWWLVFGSLFFAFVIGLFSGALPAYQASKLKPVDTLRDE